MTQARDLGDAANKANFLDNVTSDVNTGISNAATAAANAAPSGMIAPFAMSSAPTGWLVCDGSAVSRTTYASLFTALGTTWGSGNGSSTFNLPDLRGAFLRGTGSHGTSNMANGNDFAGPSVGSFENDQFQDHTHDSPRVSAAGANWNNGSATGLYEDVNAGVVGKVATESAYLTTYSLDSPRLGDETRPFNAGVNYCIKT